VSELPRGDSAPGRATRFFVWCAGADPAVLATVPGSERIKQAGFGTLVLVPAVLALCSMTYALSTLSDRAWVYVGGGVLWATIVFCFDRFIVSTFRKSKETVDDVTSLVFVSRLVFAAFVGVLVAHPLVMLYFSETIEERLAVERRDKVAAIAAEFASRETALDGEIDRLRKEIRRHEAARNAAQRMLVDEIDGVVSGRTTGIPGRGASAGQKELQLRVSQHELELTRDRNSRRIAAVEREAERLREESRAARDGFHQPLDYLARAGALESLAAEHPHIERVKWFLILFFVFVDTLPIVFKALSPRGPYDDRLQLAEYRVARQTSAAREALDETRPEAVRAARRRELARLALDPASTTG
jgi:hypothetical protein